MRNNNLSEGDTAIEKIITLHSLCWGCNSVLSAFLQLGLVVSKEIATFSESDFQAFENRDKANFHHKLVLKCKSGICVQCLIF